MELPFCMFKSRRGDPDAQVVRSANQCPGYFSPFVGLSRVLHRAVFSQRSAPVPIIVVAGC